MKQNVLIIGRDAEESGRIRNFLKDYSVYDIQPNAIEIEAAIADFHPQLVVFNIESEEVRLCRKLFAIIRAKKNIPILLSVDFDKHHAYIDLLATAVLFPPLQKKQIIPVIENAIKNFRAEIELIESEKRYRTIVDNIPVGIYRSEAGVGGHIIEANPAMVKILGCKDKSSLLEKKVVEFYSATNDRDKFVGTAIKDGGINNAKLLLKRANGEIFNATNSLTAIKNDEGKTVFFDGIIEDVTQQIKMQDELRETYKTLLENPNPFFQTDKNGVFIIFNEEAKKIIKKNKYTNICEIFPDLKNTIFENTDEKLSEIVESNWNNRDFIIKVVRKVSEKNLLFFATEVTAIKSAQKHSVDNENKFKAIAETVSEAIILMDDRGKIRYWNKGAMKIFGYTKREIMGKDLHLALASEEYRSVFKSRFQNFIKTGKGPAVGQSVELNTQKKDGTNIIIELSLNSLILEDHWFAVGIARDVTEAKSLEKKLRILSTVVEQSSEGIMIADIEGNITFVNNAWTLLHAYEAREELIGKPLSICHNQEQIINDVIPFNQKVKENGFHSGEVGHIRKDGTPFPTLMSSTLLMDEQGKPHSITSLARDITERKQAEEKLLLAKESAEVANRAKSEFLANMSHEIRTPMNGIIGMTELALDTNLNPEQEEYIMIVRDSADELLRIINDILDFSKIEAGKMEIEKVPFNIRDSLKHTINTLAFRAQEKNLEFICYFHSDVPENIKGDPGRLKQILINLLGNAIKFTSDGEIIVDISVLNDSDANVELLISVKDSGIGIPKEKLGKIFESFSQADGSTTRQFGGTGLGLTISSKLVNMMSGELRVDSSPGKGSRFYFNLIVEKSISGSAQSSFVSKEELHNKKVLIVDDNNSNRKILFEILKSWEMDAFWAESVDKAIKMVEKSAQKNQPFDLFLVDLQMPKKDGFQFIREAKEIDTKAKVVMMSSDGRRLGKEDCEHFGIEVYMPKPLMQKDLLKTLKEILNEKENNNPIKPEDEENTQESIIAEGLRILLAEDNPVNQKLAERILVKRGHIVKVVENGELLMQAMDNNSYDVILMDVQMPVMDGLTATAKIRQLEKSHGGHIPIVAMTAHAMKGDKDRFLAAGMDDYISKPIKPIELFSALNKVQGNDEYTGNKNSSPASMIDRERLLSKFGGDNNLYKEFLSVFFKQLPLQMRNIRSAITLENFASLIYYSRILSSSLHIFNLYHFQKMFIELEKAGLEKNILKAKNIYTTLGSKLNLLIKELVSSSTELIEDFSRN